MNLTATQAAIVHIATKGYLRDIGCDEGMGFYDAVPFAENIIAELPGWEHVPYVDITDAAADVCAAFCEDRG